MIISNKDKENFSKFNGEIDITKDTGIYIPLAGPPIPVGNKQKNSSKKISSSGQKEGNKRSRFTTKKRKIVFNLDKKPKSFRLRNDEDDSV